MKKTAQLRKLLKEEPYIFTAGCYDAISAKMCEMAGIKLVYMSGYSVSLGLLGKADLSFVGRKEMVETASRMVAAVDIPLISDADEGYGGPPQVQYTVEEFEKAGVAGIHIEDQPFPKRCGHISGKQVLPFNESVGKIESAVAAKSDPDFVIIARTDALGAVGGSMGEAINRSIAYADVGADLLWCEFGSPSRSLAEEYAERVRKVHPNIPLAFNYSSSFKWHQEENPMTFKELAEMGYKYIFITLFAIHSATLGMNQFMQKLASEEQEGQLLLESEKINNNFNLTHHQMGNAGKYQDIEAKYSPASKDRIKQSTEGFKDGERD